MDEQERVGLYITKETRCRLNLFKAQYALRMGRFVKQSEAIDALLDLAGIDQGVAQANALPPMDLRSQRAAA